MGATIVAGLSGLAVLMGLTWLISWTNQNTLKRGDRDNIDITAEGIPRPGTEIHGIDTSKDIYNTVVNPGVLVNPDAGLSDFEKEQRYLENLRKNEEIPEEYQGIDWTNRPTTVQPNFESNISNEKVQENPYEVLIDTPNVETKPLEGEKEEDIPKVEDVPKVEEKEEIKPTIPTPTPTPSTDIKDTTNENQEFSIDTSSLQAIIDQVNKDYADRIAREDAIRKENQEREDNAYERAVASMRRAGINPNLMNVVQAASGGGITNASQKDYSIWQSEVNKQLALLEQQIQNNFQGTENDKKNFMQGISTLITLFAIGAKMK